MHSLSTSRINVILSGSTVHEHFLWEDYKGDLVHIDYETAPGAKIETLEQMFINSYQLEKCGLDILLIGGLNNFKFDTNDEIMEKIRHFSETVKAQSDTNHPDNPSTFRVGTLLMAPQFVWFPGNGPKPHKNYVNNLDRMLDLNRRILQFNQARFVEQAELYKSASLSGRATPHRSTM